MKVFEVQNRLPVYITLEQSELLQHILDQGSVIEKTKLDERQQVLANQLVNQDILIRKNNENKKTTYTIRTIE